MTTSERPKKPEDVPSALVEKAIQASHEDAHKGDWSVPVKWTDWFTNPEDRRTLRRGTRVDIAAVWNDIYMAGYEHGFLDRDDDKFDEMANLPYAPHIGIWLDGATSEQAEEMFDKILDAADAAKPENVDIGAIGSMSPGAHKKMEEVDEQTQAG